MLKLLNLGMTGVTQGDTAPVFGSKINHMVEELYDREGVDLQTNELPEARPINTGGTGATSQKSAAKNILPAASARQTIRYNGTDWVSEDEVTQIALATDWDTLVNAGVYYAPFVLGDGVNSPPDIWAYGFLRVTRSGDWIMQEAFGDDSRKNTRFSVNGGVTWKVWSDESTTADTARKLLNSVKINGTDFDGTQDINIPSMPIGVPILHGGLRSTIETGYAAYDGQLLSRTSYPIMWAKVQAAFPIITDADWLANPSKRGSYSSGDGTTTFRMPDYNGVQTNSLKGLFLRGDGGGTIGGVAVSSGTTVLSDAIRNIQGDISFHTGSSSGSASVLASASGALTTSGALSSYSQATPGYATSYQNALFSAANVVPTAAENRPVSAVGVWICRVGNTLTEVANPTLHAVLTGGNTFNGGQAVVGDLTVSGGFTVNGVGMFGVGQDWKDVKSTRIKNVRYTNTTGRAIALFAYVAGTYPVAIWTKNKPGVDILVGACLNTSSASNAGAFGIIPSGAEYFFETTSPTVLAVSELTL